MNPPSLREICQAAKVPDFPRNREFCVREVLISHCGANLTPDRVDTIGRELVHEMEHGNMSWAFKESPLAARFSPETALAVYEAMQSALLRLEHLGSEETGRCAATENLRSALALLDGRTEP